MGWRFRKSVSLGKHLRINFNKNSISVSGGRRGFRYTVNSKGTITKTIGIPGTGLYYTQQTNLRRQKIMEKNRTIILQMNQRMKELEEKYKQEQKQRVEAAVLQEKEILDYLSNNHLDYYKLDLDKKFPIENVKLVETKPPFNVEEAGPFEQEVERQIIFEKPPFLNKIIPSRKKAYEQRISDLLDEAKLKDQQLYKTWEKGEKQKADEFKIIQNRNKEHKLAREKFKKRVLNTRQWTKILKLDLTANEIFGCKDIKFKTQGKNIDVDLFLDFQSIFPKEKLFLSKARDSFFYTYWTRDEIAEYFWKFIKGRVLSVSRSIYSFVSPDKIRITVIHRIPGYSFDFYCPVEEAIFSVVINLSELQDENKLNDIDFFYNSFPYKKPDDFFYKKISKIDW